MKGNLVRSPLAVLAALLLSAGPVSAQGGDLIYLDLASPGPLGPGIPPNCASWHELWPAYCSVHHQDLYGDKDGDGMISPCDNIKLDGHDFHIVWVGPTYFLRCVATGQDAAFEPTDPGTGGNPTCEVWHQIYPIFSQQQHVEGWQDNGDGVLSVCDHVFIGGCWWHIERIGLNIIIEPGPVSIESESWGKVKESYRN